jgi:predicted O-methyltransferase YrrM
MRNMFRRIRSHLFADSQSDQNWGLRASGWEVFDVSATQNHGDLAADMHALDAINWSPASLGRAERLMLYTLTYCLRPRVYLEIGTLNGGSALIVWSAMNALGGDGRIIIVDPDPKISEEHWGKLLSRATIVPKFSPQAVDEAHQIAQANFDLVFIDGDHHHNAVIQDAEAVLHHMSAPGHIVFHDGYNVNVATAVRDFVRKHRSYVTDCGMLTREYTHWDNDTEPWSGFHVVKVVRKVA